MRRVRQISVLGHLAAIYSLINRFGGGGGGICVHTSERLRLEEEKIYQDIT